MELILALFVELRSSVKISLLPTLDDIIYIALICLIFTQSLRLHMVGIHMECAYHKV